LDVAPVVPPIGRFIEPSEIAAYAAFLLSADAGAITGQQLLICGGASL
jgi:NAD(P)-dependent dehydrogenase (short-subunit alcohol dehydrogenase family)